MKFRVKCRHKHDYGHSNLLEVGIDEFGNMTYSELDPAEKQYCDDLPVRMGV